jgi:hypothetical protein
MNTSKHVPELNIVEWEKAGDGYLIVTINVCGCPMHLEAHGVAWRHDDGTITSDRPDTGLQIPFGEDSQFDELNRAFSCDGPQQTVTIDGKLYVLFASAQGE